MGERPAYVLHSRPYRETSALVDFLTPEGRVCAVMRGARRRQGTLVRPFVPLLLSYQGRSELRTVYQLEPAGPPLWLVGEHLYGGFYLNELLVRLLLPEAGQGHLFDDYVAAVEGLAQRQPLEPLLRGFEWCLLQALGYGFSLYQDVSLQPVVAAGHYRLLPDAGLQRLPSWQPHCFQGAELLAMQVPDWTLGSTRVVAKRLMRQAFAPLLKGRPLVSRELFIKYKECSRD